MAVVDDEEAGKTALEEEAEAEEALLQVWETSLQMQDPHVFRVCHQCCV